MPDCQRDRRSLPVYGEEEVTGDAYAVATAKDLDNGTERNVTLLVGADDDYDAFEDEAGFKHLIERFRDEPA